MKRYYKNLIKSTLLGQLFQTVKLNSFRRKSLTEEKVEKHKELLYSPVTEDNAKKFIELLMQ